MYREVEKRSNRLISRCFPVNSVKRWLKIGRAIGTQPLAVGIVQHIYQHKSLDIGKSSDIVKQEIEADLREYVQNQLASDPKYVRGMVSANAAVNLQRYNSLNELIADVMLRADKRTGKDSELLKLVGDIFYDDQNV